MPRQIRLVHITLAIKEEAFAENPLGPEQEIEALLTENACSDPESTIQDWKYTKEKPQDVAPVTVSGDLPVFDELNQQKFVGNPLDGRTRKSVELLAKATEQLGKSPDECSLDDLIHDVASLEASNVNNRTLESRIQFLQENGSSDEEILKALTSEE